MRIETKLMDFNALDIADKHNELALGLQIGSLFGTLRRV